MDIDYEIPGFLTDTLFYLRTLTTISVLSIGLQTYVLVKPHIGRKYFYQLRKPRGGGRRVKSESNWKKYYGSSDELNRERSELGNNAFFKREILSLHATKGKVNFEETRQLFIHGVLTEDLDDGTPAYYNSNILGRYYRKDYFPHDF